MAPITPTSPDPKNWTVTALIAKWGIDQLTKNAVSVNLGNSTIQFVKQPDGSFTPPANCTMSLTPAGGGWVLEERHGRTFNFDYSTPAFPNANVLTEIADQYRQLYRIFLLVLKWHVGDQQYDE